MSETKTSKHRGSCHCGAIRYEVDIDLAKGVSRCNCTLCLKLGATGAIVKPEAFTLVAGRENLGEYAWGMKVATRYFCKTCGIQCHSRGFLEVLGGDFVSVNVNTLDDIEHSELHIGYFDGRHNNWQAGVRKTPWPVLRASA